MPTSNALCNYKQKVEYAVSMVATMSAEQKLEAVQFWNIMSEKLQEIVNHSAADISAISFAMEKEKRQQQVSSEYIEDAAGQTYHLLTSTNNTGSTMALITKYSKAAEAQNATAKPEPAATVVIDKTTKSKEEPKIAIEDDVDDPDDPDPIAIEDDKQLEKPKEKTKETKEATADDSEIVECDCCDKTFTSSTQLAAHKSRHVKPYICNECGARFASKGNLIVHTRSHTGEKPYTCAVCGASFSTRGNLKRHDKAHSGDKPWWCTWCGASFTENKSLKVHMRRHTGERPYKCTECPKAFAQKGTLRSHIALHLDEKSHLCHTCGKAFRQKTQLRLHTLRHSNVKRFTCSSCPAQFLTKGDMDRHFRTHTGQKPFMCGICKKTFTRQQTLTEHMNRHYGLKPYLCKYCRKAFAEMSACYKHIKTHEKEGGIQRLTQAVEVDALVIDGAIVSIEGPPGTSVVVEQDSAPQTIEVAKNEMILSDANQPSEIKSKAVNALQKVNPAKDSNVPTITVLESSKASVD